VRLFTGDLEVYIEADKSAVVQLTGRISLPTSWVRVEIIVIRLLTGSVRSSLLAGKTESGPV